jgi:hypothetical protein
MPAEYAMLRAASVPLVRCRECGDEPFRPFLRGMVQRPRYSWRTLWLPIGAPRAYCALICSACKEIVGYEHAFPAGSPDTTPEHDSDI